MIEFEKNIEKVLPYDRRQYITFLNADSAMKWLGVSFQLAGVSEGKDIGVARFVARYQKLFKNVVLQLDNGSFWIVNHDDKDLKWLPNDDDHLTDLRTLFKDKDISNAFKGALLCGKDDLLKLSKDIISYPYAALSKDGLLYKNLDISHGEFQFIIKISGHLNVDFLSTDKELLKKVASKNGSNSFIIKEYRGTSL